jgi:hypothetical protein
MLARPLGVEPTRARKRQFVMKALKFIGVVVLSGCVCTAEEKVPLVTELPKPLFVGTPVSVDLPNLEQAPVGKRPPFLVPAGTVNLAKGKTVTASDPKPIMGTLAMVTDGDKSAEEGSYIELHRGKQWVQIDLEHIANIHAILVWHYHCQARAYHCVVVQVSDDPKFEQGVTTVFNTDLENALGLGLGQDRAYLETYQGKLIDAKGVKGRYVRLYSKGNTTDNRNHYIEVEVFGTVQ